jgi:arylsulfatase A
MHAYTTNEAMAVQLDGFRRMSPTQRVSKMCKLSASLRRPYSGRGNRTHAMTRIAAILFTACFFFAFECRAATKPNIILILADDLGYGSLGCYGNAGVKTPHIDRLAAGGMRFTDFHSNGALCSPTRAALLTGRYQQRCIHVADEEISPVFREQRKENTAQRWAWGISKSEITLPAVLRQAGYRTALIGKWHLGYDRKFHPMEYGFDEFRGWLGGAVDNHTHIATHGTRELDWWNGRTLENDQGYSTDLLTGYATDFISRHKDVPFFLLLAHGAVHTPLQGRDPLGKKSPVDLYTEIIGTLDDSVGAVVAELHKHQLDTTTLVVFSSDNGPAAPSGFPASGGLRGKKGTLHEGGHRVPFIAAWPGQIAAGAVSDAPVMTMDLLPTFAALAGAALPTDRLMDGVDITPVLKGKPAMPRDLHWQSGETWAIHRGSWKLTGKGSKSTALVNLQSELAESQNLLATEPEKAAALLNAHLEWASALGTK